MQRRTEVHLHIHEGALPATVEAAVRAALGSGNGAGALPEVPGGGEADAETHREYWARSYNESQEDAEGKARPLLKFLALNPERLIPYTEVSKALGYTNSRSLPGLLGAFGRRADHRYKGVRPFERTWANGQWHLRMSKDAAEVISGLY
jgi:hypothetical protein